MMRCPVCGRLTRSRSYPFLNVGRHRHPTFDGRHLSACSRCDSMWCTDAPTNGELGDYYATSYVPARMGEADKDTWPIWDTRAYSQIMLARLFVDWAPGDLFVDVGPGNGAALSVAPLLLRDAHLGCVEFNPHAIEFFRRHVPDITVTESIEEFAPGSAKMVYSAHSLEHYRPGDAFDGLRGIARALAPGGVLALEVPWAPSARTIAAGRHTPHLLFFSPQGLQRLLTRAGFEVVLWFTSRGRRGNRDAVADHPVPPDLGRGLAARLSTFVTGDLMASVPRDGQPIKGVIKVVAVNGGRRLIGGQADASRMR